MTGLDPNVRLNKELWSLAQRLANGRRSASLSSEHRALPAEGSARFPATAMNRPCSGVRGEVFRLGPKVVFKTSDPTVEEWRRLLRVRYADGGMFATKCIYLEFLGQRFAPNSGNEVAARQKELPECGLLGLPRNQAEMRQLLETGGDPAHAMMQPKQTGLAL